MYKDVVKTIDELDPLIAMSLMDLSNSRIETLEGEWGCEAKYFYNYIAKEPDPGNPASLLGNVIHTVLENLVENEKPLDLDELIYEYKLQLDKYDEEGYIPHDLRQVGLVMIEDYYETNKDETHGLEHLEDKRIYEKELWFEIVVGRAKMRGSIDRVDIMDHRVEIVDYKSGKHEVPLKHIAKNLQLGIYALAAKTMFPDKEVHASLYYLRSGKQKGHLFSDSDLDGVVERILDVTDKISGITEFKPTANKRICRYCPHAASGVCSTGKYVLNH
jgi:RecB family exonuclease